MNKSKILKKYLNLTGRSVVAVKSGERNCFIAVVQETWHRNRTNFEQNSSEIGRYRNDYYLYNGPASCNIFALGEDDYLEIDGERYYFVQKHAVKIGNIIQFYRGVLKKAEGEDNDVFAS